MKGRLLAISFLSLFTLLLLPTLAVLCTGFISSEIKPGSLVLESPNIAVSNRPNCVYINPPGCSKKVTL